MERYSIKMRASNEVGGRRNHISGAEKIVSEDQLEEYCSHIIKRALKHSKGKPDFINLKIEAIQEDETGVRGAKGSSFVSNNECD